MSAFGRYSAHLFQILVELNDAVGKALVNAALRHIKVTVVGAIGDVVAMLEHDAACAAYLFARVEVHQLDI